MAINLENLGADRKRYEENKKIKESQKKDNIFIHESTGLKFKFKPRKIDVFFKDEKITFIPLQKNGLAFKSQKRTDEALKLISKKTSLDKDSVNNAKNEIEDILLDREEEDLKSDGLFTEILSDKPNNASALIELGQEMKDKYNIIRTEDGEYYYLDKYYRPLSIGRYQILVENEFNLKLSERYLKDSITSISGEEIEKENLWEFADGYYYNCLTEEIEELSPQLTSKKFIINDKLIEYNPDVEFINDEPTLIEKTLREIFIPKNNPEDTDLYLNHLYFLGKSLLIGNPLKAIIIYYNDIGNNGKTAIGIINDILFGNFTIKPRVREIQDDNFFQARADNTHTIIIDEIDKGSLNGCWDTIKNITGGSGNDDRQMYSTTRGKGKGKGTLMILTNYKPDIPLTDRALLYRALLYELPNEFVEYEEGKELDENQYWQNDKIFTELQNDEAGKEWLCNVIIKAVKEHEYVRQTREESKDILLEDNILTKYLNDHTEILSTGILYNNDILNKIENSNINVDMSSSRLKQEIGYSLRRIYGNELEKKHGQGVYYNLKWI